MATTLQRGSSGPEVRALQQRLNELGAAPPLAVDGAFGERTHAAVVAFQTARGLAPDGVVGPLTRAALGLDGGTGGTGEPQDFKAGVPVPVGINPGVSAARQATMLSILGRPGELTENCSPVTDQRLARLMVESADVGPFQVTGIRPAVEALQRLFAAVRQAEPALFSSLGTAGMLCVRRVRRTSPPPSPNFSNHSWGTAIDIKIDGVLDPVGNGQAMRGLVLLHPFFNAERFFWGAGFGGGGEDSMHFEASDELVQDWSRQGVLE